MRKNNRQFLFVVFALVTFVGVSASNAFKPGHGVPFRHLDNREVTAFARKLFDETYRNEIVEVEAWSKDEEQKSRLRWLLHEGFPFGTLYADIDINDDGVPERFIQFSDPYGCGSVGCLTFIYRRIPKGFELICSTYLADVLMKQGQVVEAGKILAATEDGYHLIDSGDGITHWDMKRKAGDQCTTISYRG